jgi:hypothetical protein
MEKSIPMHDSYGVPGIPVDEVPVGRESAVL